MEVLEKWYKNCIDWCFARSENGRFGDQKYLDAWPAQYPHTVHILKQRGILAPWNVQQYKIRRELAQLFCQFRSTITPVIFYHFHAFDALDDKTYFLGWYPLSAIVKNYIYNPYIQKLESLENSLGHKLLPDYPLIFKKSKRSDHSIRWIRKLKFNLIGIYLQARLFTYQS